MSAAEGAPLPRLIVITDWSMGEAALLTALRSLLELGGAEVAIQHRHPEADDRTFLREARMLAELCRAAQVPLFVNGRLDIALTVGAHIAQALEAAHEKHIIHRNVSPENILIRTKDKAAKLGDMMLAKAMEGIKAKQITKPGELFVLYVAAYAVFRFFVEFTRANETVWLDLTRPQWFLLPSLVLIGCRLWYGSRHGYYRSPAHGQEVPA